MKLSTQYLLTFSKGTEVVKFHFKDKWCILGGNYTLCHQANCNCPYKLWIMTSKVKTESRPKSVVHKFFDQLLKKVSDPNQSRFTVNAHQGVWLYTNISPTFKRLINEIHHSGFKQILPVEPERKTPIKSRPTCSKHGPLKQESDQKHSSASSTHFILFRFGVRGGAGRKPEQITSRLPLSSGFCTFRFILKWLEVNPFYATTHRTSNSGSPWKEKNEELKRLYKCYGTFVAFCFAFML